VWRWLPRRGVASRKARVPLAFSRHAETAPSWPIADCSSTSAEFAQNVWINDPKFHELGNERDPLIGNEDGTFDMTRPIRKKITGMPAFTTVLGGAYFFLPGIKSLRFLAAL